MLIQREHKRGDVFQFGGILGGLMVNDVMQAVDATGWTGVVRFVSDDGTFEQIETLLWIDEATGSYSINVDTSIWPQATNDIPRLLMDLVLTTPDGIRSTNTIVVLPVDNYMRSHSMCGCGCGCNNGCGSAGFTLMPYVNGAGSVTPSGTLPNWTREPITFVVGQTIYPLSQTLSAYQQSRAILDVDSAPDLTIGDDFTVNATTLTISAALAGVLRTTDIIVLSY